MPPTTVTYLGDLQCQAVHGLSQATLVTDAPPDNQGKGRSFSPTDLVGTAMATCMLTIMGIAAQRHGLNIAGATASVEKTMSATTPRRIARLAVEIRVPGTFSDQDRQRLEAAAHGCPVHRSLHPDIDAPIVFRWD